MKTKKTPTSESKDKKSQQNPKEEPKKVAQKPKEEPTKKKRR